MSTVPVPPSIGRSSGTRRTSRTRRSRRSSDVSCRRVWLRRSATPARRTGTTRPRVASPSAARQELRRLRHRRRPSCSRRHLRSPPSWSRTRSLRRAHRRRRPCHVRAPFGRWCRFFFSHWRVGSRSRPSSSSSGSAGSARDRPRRPNRARSARLRHPLAGRPRALPRRVRAPPHYRHSCPPPRLRWRARPRRLHRWGLFTT